MTNLYHINSTKKHKGMSKLEAHTHVVDAADCLLNAHETLLTVEKKCPSLAPELEFIRAKVFSLKNELVNKAGLIHSTSLSLNSEPVTLTALPWGMQAAG